MAMVAKLKQVGGSTVNLFLYRKGITFEQESCSTQLYMQRGALSEEYRGGRWLAAYFLAAAQLLISSS
jgi:hypothetical protein